jgi:single-strand DNA-binding protein
MLPYVNAEMRVATDPDLRYAPSGVAVTRMRAVASSRKKNDQTGEWEDDKSCWCTLTAFRRVAENIAESFSKGDLVMVSGKLQTDEWEDRDGNKRTTVNVLVDNIGMSAAFHAVTALKSGKPQEEKVQKQQGGTPSQAQEDPWTSPQSEEPPF